jgi:ABC-type transport system involved in multi-copper enzyme maturation permease subunit
MPLFSIANITMKGYLKEKVPVVVLVFALVLILSSYVLSPLAVGARQKITIDIGLASISLLGILMIILLGAASFYREKEKGILTTILSKPVSRVDFIVGKYFGTVATISMVMILMSIVFLGMLFLSGTDVTANIVWAIYLSILEVMLLSAVMVFFSSFSTPILSSFFTICVFVSGHLSKDILSFGRQLGSGAFGLGSRIAFYALPNLSLFNIRSEAVHGISLQEGFLYSVTIYGLFYTVFLLLMSSLIFRAREIT